MHSKLPKKFFKEGLRYSVQSNESNKTNIVLKIDREDWLNYIKLYLLIKIIYDFCFEFIELASNNLFDAIITFNK